MGNIKLRPVADPAARSTMPLRLLCALTLGSLLTACTVGPDFKQPAVPDTQTYTHHTTPLTSATAPGLLGNAQQVKPGLPVSSEWWRSFESNALNKLIDDALKASPTMASAQATLRQAQENYASKAGSTLYPQANLGIGAERQRFNPSSQGQTDAPTTFSLYSTSVDVSYQLDLVGGNRRALESLAAQAEYQQYQLEGAQLTLAGNIATSAITDARLAGQIQATEAMLKSMEQQLLLTQGRVRLGQAAADEVLTLKTQVEQTRALLPPLHKQREQNKNLMAVLSGQTPGSAILPDFTLAQFRLPAELPLTLPSELVRRRPDIRASEALVHAANADYGVAVANMYPQLNLSASMGSQALSTDALFGSNSSVWNLIGQLTQPLFNPGLPAAKRAALAGFDAATANYKNVVLDALRNVSDTLYAVENDAQALAALASADVAAEGSLQSTQKKHILGSASTLDILVAQQQAEQTKVDLIAAQAQRLADTAALYQSMGGGL